MRSLAWWEREVERGEKDPQYTDFDLQLVTVAYNSLMTGYALEDMVVAMEEEAPYRAQGNRKQREAAEASGKYFLRETQKEHMMR